MSTTIKNVPYAELSDCRKAAIEILSATHVLLSAGAGMSADSGLPVYNQIADVPAYNTNKLSYSDLCQPKWYQKDQEIYYGFWGKCYNDYKGKDPHRGYTVLWKLVERMFKSDVEEGRVGDRYFVYTSNVDSHFIKCGFPKERVYEIHGSCMEWHCVKPCEERNTEIFSLDEDFSFRIDSETMRAELKDPKGKDLVPVCRKCGLPARPRVLMFGDDLWLGSRKTDYYKYINSIKEDPSAKLVIIELGCGKRIPTVREQSESLITDPKLKDRCTLIRVNPDFPECAYPNTISIQAKAEDAISKIYNSILTKNLWLNKKE